LWNRKKKGVLKRLIETVMAWAKTVDYSSFDYTLDRVAGLEQELTKLREELHRSLPDLDEAGQPESQTSKSKN
jgi:hypothetical protein